ncbi:uncharacterized protein NECHADRAFT_78063 [Fusarium vanettenii 77-13-4]|uniref:DNA damage-responsive protein 48 n=1 Tax=Fusarium vanettenii (strain ATCC MYA-4622 / CBS 123669 / FGSC 9596 / NRRL 45880 / 77-13-4) TaxID=660122 RepID=C7YN06_FUSV7|nr:uncharacterized protein NECHADRAFT_78063 [Fusarium vanettenii 77-13-4]EEU47041.1 hypothetical protein NECHADRAFT_78063 [Fusarium vanettenii 77-13-4]
MDLLNKVTGGGSNNADQNQNQNQNQESGSGGGFMDKINGMAGGGAKGEKNEDGLDKAVDYMQEKFLGQGDQSNESAAEQAKDEAISDFIRDKYKESTGKEFFVADKDKKFGA